MERSGEKKRQNFIIFVLQKRKIFFSFYKIFFKMKETFFEFFLRSSFRELFD